MRNKDRRLAMLHTNRLPNRLCDFSIEDWYFCKTKFKSLKGGSKYHWADNDRKEMYLCDCGREFHLKQKTGSAFSKGIKRNLKREDW